MKTTQYQGSIAVTLIRIYGLLDPGTDELRYVGRTKGSLKSRLSGHIRAARSGQKWYCARWINTVLAAGREPEIVEIETVPLSEWQAAEQFWIAYYRAIGARLTNATDGGDGSVGARQAPETVAKRAAALRGKKRSPEVRAAMSLRAMGRKGRTGQKLTQEHKEKIASAHIGMKHSPETRDKRRLQELGKKRPAWVREKMRAARLAYCARAKKNDRQSDLAI